MNLASSPRAHSHASQPQKEANFAVALYFVVFIGKLWVRQGQGLKRPSGDEVGTALRDIDVIDTCAESSMTQTHAILELIVTRAWECTWRRILLFQLTPFRLNVTD